MASLFCLRILTSTVQIDVFVLCYEVILIAMKPCTNHLLALATTYVEEFAEDVFYRTAGQTSR